MEWVKVTDKLPDEYQNVLTYEAGYKSYSVAERSYNDSGTEYFFNGDVMLTPSHWMALPGVPNE
jgi:hypothetical protein